MRLQFKPFTPPTVAIKGESHLMAEHRSEKHYSIMITQEQLQYLFEYRNGHFIWRRNLPSKGGLKNTLAGYSDKSNGNCWMITINGKKRQLHRLVYLYYYGTWPEKVYHLDGNPLNNKIENLTNSRQDIYKRKSNRLPERFRTAVDVREVFDYRVGELCWKDHTALGRGAGGVKAGYVDKQSGLKVLNYRGHRYQVHRLIYLYHFDKNRGPLYFIDGDMLNTKIQNLSDIEMVRVELDNGDFDYVIL